MGNICQERFHCLGIPHESSGKVFDRKQNPMVMTLPAQLWAMSYKWFAALTRACNSAGNLDKPSGQASARITITGGLCLNFLLTNLARGCAAGGCTMMQNARKCNEDYELIRPHGQMMSGRWDPRSSLACAEPWVDLMVDPKGVSHTDLAANSCQTGCPCKPHRRDC